MKIKNILSFFIASIILLTFLFALNNNNIYDTKDLVGKKIESVKLQSFDNGIALDINELKKNNFTLINFWASWCAPCRLEHNHLLSLKKDFKLKILGVNFKDKKNNAKIFLNDFEDPYHYLAVDKNGKLSIHFGVYGIPESILIDKNLRVMKKIIGPISDKDFKEITKIINNEN